MKYSINTPLSKETVSNLKAGDIVEISGTIYAARDAAHQRLASMMEEGKPLPFELKDQIIYYVGPCPARPGMVIGSAGPTTSGRMDKYTPRLLEAGLTGMIGKGARSREVIDSIIANKAVYFGAIGGAAALIAQSIVSEEIITFPELGPEAVRMLTVRNFPATVIIDSSGESLYETGKKKYCI